MSIRIALLAVAAAPFFALEPAANAQVVEAWSQQLDSSVFGEFPTDLVVDAGGNVTVVGGAVTGVGSGPPPPMRAFAAHYDTQGALQWTRSLDPAPGTRRTSFVEAALTSTGDIVTCGNTQSVLGPTVQDIVVVSYDASGNVLWSVSYDTPGGGLENCADIAVETSGDVWVVGTASVGALSDWLVLKYSSTGALLWSRTLDGSAHAGDSAATIALDGHGGAFVAGSVNDVAGFYQVGLARLDAAGNVMWSREYSGTGPGYGVAADVVVDAAGDVYVAGTTRQGSVDAFTLLKYDSAGAQQWVHGVDDMFSQPRAGLAWQAVVDEGGKIIVAGVTLNPSSPSDALIAKFDATGQLEWANPWNGALNGEDLAYRVGIDTSGEIFVGGSTRTSAGPGGIDSLLLRLDPLDGAVRFETTWGAPNFNDSFNGLAVGPIGAVTVVSQTKGPHCCGDSDVLTKRFDSTSYAFCFGDGTGAACPCGNESAVGEREGCRNSIGVGGKLTEAGSTSLSADYLQLFAYQMPLNTSALFFQGTTSVANGAGVAFGDGLRCAGGTNVRIALRNTGPGGLTTYPQGVEVPVSVRGFVTSPGTRVYQVDYRNAANFCTPATFNLSNGLLVTWVP